LDTLLVLLMASPRRVVEGVHLEIREAKRGGLLLKLCDDTAEERQFVEALTAAGAMGASSAIQEDAHG
jgi:hypothetical protein